MWYEEHGLSDQQTWLQNGDNGNDLIRLLCGLSEILYVKCRVPQLTQKSHVMKEAKDIKILGNFFFLFLCWLDAKFRTSQSSMILSGIFTK